MPPVASSPRGSSTSTSIPRPPSAERRDLGFGPPGRHHPSHGPGRLRLGSLAPDQSADLWRSTAFAYGQPDLRPEWPTIESYLGASRASRRSTSSRWRRTRRSASRPPAGMRAQSPTTSPGWRPHPRVDGGGRGRSQHRPRLPARGELRDRRADRPRPGRARVRRHLRRFTCYNRAGKPDAYRESIAIGRRRHPDPALARDRRRRPSHCSTRLSGRASTSASTSTSTRRIEPPARLARGRGTDRRVSTRPFGA